MGHSSHRDRSRSKSPSRKHRSSGDKGEKSKHKDKSSSKHHSSRHRHSDDEDDSRRSKRRDKDRDETEEERKLRKKLKKEKKRAENGDGLGVVDDDDDGAMWVEKSIDGAEAASHIPTSDALDLKSNTQNPQAPLPASVASETQGRERDAWMLDPGPITTAASAPREARDIPKSAGSGSRTIAPPGGMTDGYGGEDASNRGLDGGVDFFSSLGTEHKKKDPNDDKPDPSKLVIDRRELNKQLLEGKTVDEYAAPEEKKVQFGGPGSQWRMMKLKRLYEQAQEQSRDVEDVAMERYGSMDDFNEAIAERSFLDEREQRRQQRRGNAGNDGFSSPSTAGMRTPDAAGGRRFMFTSDEGIGASGSRPASRAGFRKPGEAPEDVSTPGVGGSRLEELKRREGGTPRISQMGLPQSKVSTPIPSVFTPTTLSRAGSGYPFATPPAAAPESVPGGSTTSKPPMSIEALNKLQAKVLRAKLMDDPDAEALEEHYETERARAAEGGGDQGGGGMWTGDESGQQGQLGRRVDDSGRAVEVQVLPTLDGRGKLYDVGLGREDAADARPGNKRKKQEKFETRDREGNLLRYNADDDEQSLGELVRQERFGAGNQKDLDAEMAANITRDARFDSGVDYMDDNVEKLAQRKRKTDAMKRAFAINDYARTKKALDSCPFCYQDDRQPLTAIVALGQRTYMCCTQTEELVPGHCLIVPLQHHMSTLEMEDDDWEEVRNFMKCLMQMHAKDNNGVLFFETILSFKQQRHTYIECVPVPFEQFQDVPAYFRESILASGTEWSQHKKLIDFSTRPGGFRRMLVPNLPYFMVQWDYKGEKGYGHIIEGNEDAKGGQEEDDYGMGEGDKGGGEFPKYFAAEIIGNLLGLDPRKWRKPRRMDVAMNKERARVLGTKFQPYNWTSQLQQAS